MELLCGVFRYLDKGVYFWLMGFGFYGLVGGSCLGIVGKGFFVFGLVEEVLRVWVFYLFAFWGDGFVAGA